jgi:ribosomal protein S18 acetylase RimI-like enzyme
MNIRFATKKDASKLLEYFGFYKDKKYSSSRVKYFLDYGKTVIAIEGKDVLGLMQYQIKENPKHGLAELEEVFVYKSHREKGVATKLLGFVIGSVRKEFNKKKITPRKLMLFVIEDNVAARKLYEKAGFKQVANVGDLFEEGKTDLLYTLDL